MDRRIETHLEAYLQGTLDARSRDEFDKALGECDAETRGLVRQIEVHSRLIRGALRPTEEPEPAAGFYARVMDRIEAQRGNSIWSVLLEPLLFRRLAYATAALLLLLTVTFATAGSSDEPTVADLLAEPSHHREVMAANDAPPVALPQQQTVVDATTVSTGSRDAVLNDLTVYSE